MKPWWRSKVVILGIIQAVLSIIDLLAGTPVGTPLASSVSAISGVSYIAARLANSNVTLQ